MKFSKSDLAKYFDSFEAQITANTEHKGGRILYQLEVRHEGLNKCRCIRGYDRGVVEQGKLK